MMKSIRAHAVSGAALLALQTNAAWRRRRAKPSIWLEFDNNNNRAAIDDFGRMARRGERVREV